MTGRDVSSAPDPSSDPSPVDAGGSAGGHSEGTFTKAPLLVLFVVFGSLLAVLVVQVLSPEETTVSTSGDVGGSGGGRLSDDSAGNAEGTGDDAPVGQDGEGATAGGPMSPAPGSADRMTDPDHVARTIAQGFQEDFRGVVDETEARCMAREVVGMFGVERLWQITQAMADANTDPEAFDRDDPRFMNEAEVRKMNSRLRPCVSDDAARRLDLVE